MDELPQPGIVAEMEAMTEKAREYADELEKLADLTRMKCEEMKAAGV